MVDARLENLTAITQRIAEQQEINTYQIGLLTEKIDSMGNRIGELRETVTTGFAEFRESLTEIKEITRRQAESIDRQAESIDRQAKSIDRLATSTERLAATVERQAATVERQSQMIERLLPNKLG